MTVGGGNPLENKGFEGTDGTQIGYLLIPSCESRANWSVPPRDLTSMNLVPVMDDQEPVSWDRTLIGPEEISE
jgi:hypothetical protein